MYRSTFLDIASKIGYIDIKNKEMNHNLFFTLIYKDVEQVMDSLGVFYLSVKD